MLKPRLIPVLLFKSGALVRSQRFEFFQATGDPVHQVERFTAWKADELIYLDITRDEAYNPFGTMQMIGSATSKRESKVSEATTFIDVIGEVAQKCFVPLTVGGKIRELEDVRMRLKHGADKVSINTKALEDPSFISQVADEFGTQCVVVSVDVHLENGTYQVYSDHGTKATGLNPVSWCVKAASMGAGEILLNSIDRDGEGKGYDTTLINMVADAIDIPVIALGGVGEYKHFADGLSAGASAVAAANIFHFTEQSVIRAKQYLQDVGIAVRL